MAAGAKAISKLEKAAELGIEVMSKDEWIARTAGTAAADPAAGEAENADGTDARERGDG